MWSYGYEECSKPWLPVAEPKSGSHEVGTRSNPDLMEGKMFKGEGGNGLTLGLFMVFELLILHFF
jgi:hypothetical protein